MLRFMVNSCFWFCFVFRSVPHRNPKGRKEGMEWNGRNGMEWNGLEWNGMEWNGMERKGKERKGKDNLSIGIREHYNV